ncbi:hypothetical protein AWM75_02390 [Aerococcus urinaehominis]|uniref:Uncharacterized protein n=1 Tax=Aerococcus urinaehominis TaxID=128944 RepID=A0A0X8FKC0_9LACT|nr:hypothetical protein [Aerococcus urinaehominis]AMB98911.1 hypothetical protein AWM75_02390 [Aerococcus urinaehominis]SDM39258.1 hypothetical protein SAMN04487985_1153 [Aerococcus urinaehominis]
MPLKSFSQIALYLCFSFTVCLPVLFDFCRIDMMSWPIYLLALILTASYYLIFNLCSQQYYLHCLHEFKHFLLLDVVCLGLILIFAKLASLGVAFSLLIALLIIHTVILSDTMAPCLSQFVFSAVILGLINLYEIAHLDLSLIGLNFALLLLNFAFLLILSLVGKVKISPTFSKGQYILIACLSFILGLVLLNMQTSLSWLQQISLLAAYIVTFILAVANKKILSK